MHINQYDIRLIGFFIYFFGNVHHSYAEGVMPVQNPDYKPDWEELYDTNRAEVDRLQKEVRAAIDENNTLHTQGFKYDSPERKALYDKQQSLEEVRDEYEEVCRRCLDTYQHKTIQDAAEWMFKTFAPSDGTIEGHGLVHDIDFETLTTIEEVREAWATARKLSEQLDAEKRLSMPTGSIPNQLFEDVGDNQIHQAWDVFTVEELFQGGNFWGASDHLKTLVTIDQRGDELHVCFMHSPEGGIGVETYIENVASAMYRRAQSIVEEGESVNPDNLHFYIHHRPRAGVFGKETFTKVDMNFSDGLYHDAKFEGFDVIPEIVQRAFHEMRFTDVHDREPRKIGQRKFEA